MDITQIVAGLRAELSRLDHAINALEGLNMQPSPRRGRPPKSKSSQLAPRKRKISAAARARMSAAQKKRWAKWKHKSVPRKAASPAKKSTGRRPTSPAMRKKLSAMMKARWAARKKAAA